MTGHAPIIKAAQQRIAGFRRSAAQVGDACVIVRQGSQTAVENRSSAPL